MNGIADLASKVVRKYFETPKNVRARGLRVNCSASCFVPKPFTPFQWEPQDTIEQFEEKQKHLCQIMHIKGVEFNWHTPQVSFLEACFARGDRKMADVLEAAWRLGCRFDGWTDQFSFENWMKAFEQCGVDPAFYANRRREKGELLPWSFIDAGVTEAYLWREHERASVRRPHRTAGKDVKAVALNDLKERVRDDENAVAVSKGRHRPSSRPA